MVDPTNVFLRLPRAISRARACPVLLRPKMAAVKSREVTTLAKTVRVTKNVNIQELARMVCAHACHLREK